MKEIKFRGKYIKTGEWHYGYVDYNKYNNICVIHTKTSTEEVIPESVCEYIGILDKNGVEIYEGDYLIDRYPIDEDDLSKGYNESLIPVVWCDKSLQWCVDASFAKDGSYLTSLVEYFGEHLEVKGNIYEN